MVLVAVDDLNKMLLLFAVRHKLIFTVQSQSENWSSNVFFDMTTLIRWR